MSKLNPQNATAYVGPGVLKQGGKTTKVPNGPLIKKKGVFKGSTLKNGGTMKKKAQQGAKIGKYTITTSTKDTIKGNPKYPGIRPPRVSTGGGKEDKGIEDVKKLLKNKAGGMIKRADGSYSKRGLWDNIRANKGSGKKPTKQMLQQEKKIKAKTKK
jgi:hypothetical protein